MLEFELTIRPSVSSIESGRIAAWFIPGSHPSRWADEISRWSTPHHKLTLIPIPRSLTDIGPIGVVVAGDALPTKELVAPMCVPYTDYQNRILIPVSAELFPSVAEKDLNELLNQDSHYVWHPAVGLIQTDKSETLNVAELFEAEFSSNDAFDRAQPGTSLPGKLTSIQMFEAPPSAEEVMRSIGGDIGQSASDPEDIPALSESTKEKLAKQGKSLAYLVLSPLAQTARFVASQVPKDPNLSEQTIFNKMENWANKVLGTISDDVLKKRHKELFRLMKMLENNPDEGLKYALPLASWFQGRGYATPGSQLTKRNVNFNLGNLFGGRGGVDVWDVPGDLQREMQNRYRELAQREINLGRFRRAAYIFAHLLGDLSAAANTLEQGKLFRDAAVLYREKLQNIPRAIECLHKGGHLTDAIELCQELAQWEKAGDICAEINQHEKALEFYQVAAETMIKNSNLTGAARIQREKIKDTDLALATLRSGWPYSGQANACLRESIQILRELSRHADVQEWLTSICNHSKNSEVDNQVVAQIADLSTNYPDVETKELALDATQVIVSRNLKRGWITSSGQLLNSLARTALYDRLLRRDCNRFAGIKLAESKKRELKRLSVKTKRKETEFTVRKQFLLSRGDKWFQAIGRSNYVLAVRYDSAATLGIERINFNGKSSKYVKLKVEDNESFRQLADATGKDELEVPRFIGPDSASHFSLSNVKLRDTFTFPEVSDIGAISIGPVPGSDGTLLTAEITSPGRWALVRAVDATIVFDVVDKNGQLLTSQFICELVDLDPAFRGSSTVFYSNGERLYVGLGKTLHLLRQQRAKETFECDHPIVKLAGTANGTRPRLAAAFDWGVQVLWDGSEQITTRICDDLFRPEVLFTRSGHLVCYSNTQLMVYSTQRNQLTLIGQLEFHAHDGDLPVAIAQGDRPDSFATLSQDGKITVYGIG